MKNTYSQKSNSATKRDRVIRLLTILIVSCSAFFSISRFLSTSGEARHFDTRWLYAAAECIRDGASPYNFSLFSGCWQNVFGADALAPFVFGVTVIIFILPMAFLDFPGASQYFDLLNAIAIGLVGWCLWVISKINASQGWQRLEMSVWIALGISMGSISGSAYVGQPAILVALGICLILLSIERQSNLTFFLGTMLCLIKPLLAIPLIIFSWLIFPLENFRGKLAVIVALLLMLLIAQLLEGNIFLDLPASLRAHVNSSVGHLTRPETLYGLRGIASSSALILISIFVGILAFATGWFCTKILPNERDGMLLALLFLGPFLFSIKNYDLSALSAVFALVARQTIKFRLLLSIPCLLIWRPALMSFFSLHVDSSGSIATVTLLCSSVSLLLIGAWCAHQVHRRSNNDCR